MKRRSTEDGGVRLFAVSVVVAASLVSGCDQIRATEPRGAYESFLKALERGEPDVAFKFLSARTRKRLTEQAEAASKASGGAIKADPVALTFPSLPRPGNVTDIRVLRREGDRAVLQITSEGRQHELPMVLEDGAWRIDA